MSKLFPFGSKQDTDYQQPIVKSWHLFLLVFFVGSLFICNTQIGKKQQKERVEWIFLDKKIIVYAYKITNDELPKPIYRNIKVVYEDNLIYREDNSNFVSNFGILPIGRQISNNRYELLLGFEDKRNEKILRLIGTGNELLKQDTLPLFQGGHRDEDADGNAEFVGFLEKYPIYCTDCDSVYYNPLQIYEMQEDGFVLDKQACRAWIDEHYSDFYGFAPNSDKRVSLLKEIESP